MGDETWIHFENRDVVAKVESSAAVLEDDAEVEEVLTSNHEYHLPLCLRDQ